MRIVAVSGILCSLLAFAGVLAGHWIWLSTLAMALRAFAGGYIRQSGDQCPAIVLASLLLCLLGIEAPGTFRQALDTCQHVLEGSGLAVALLLALCSMLVVAFLNRQYAISAFFITVPLILLFHILEPLSWTLAVIRLANTLMGCALAILGGYAFWPLWERKRFPMLQREAVEKNRRYPDRCLDVLPRGRQVDAEFYLQLLREGQIASCNVFDSEQRMASEPSSQPQDRDWLYALACSTLHLSRDITALSELSRQAYRRLPAEKIPMLKRWFQLHWDQLEHLLEPLLPASASPPSELPGVLELPGSGSDPLFRQLLLLSEEFSALEAMLLGEAQLVAT